jgi:hypothetical protein
MGTLINFVSQSCDYYYAFLSPFGNRPVECACNRDYCVACRLRISKRHKRIKKFIMAEKAKEPPVLCAFLRAVKVPADVPAGDGQGSTMSESKAI